MTRLAPILLAAAIALHGAPADAQRTCGTHAGMMVQLSVEIADMDKPSYYKGRL